MLKNKKKCICILKIEIQNAETQRLRNATKRIHSAAKSGFLRAKNVFLLKTRKSHSGIGFFRTLFWLLKL